MVLVHKAVYHISFRSFMVFKMPYVSCNKSLNDQASQSPSFICTPYDVICINLQLCKYLYLRHNSLQVLMIFTGQIKKVFFFVIFIQMSFIRPGVNMGSVWHECQ